MLDRIKVLSESWFWYEVISTTAVLVVAWGAAELYRLLVDRFFRRYVVKTPTALDDQVLSVVRRPGFLLIILVGIYAALHRYKFRLLIFLDGLLFVLSVVLVVYTLIRSLTIILRWYGEKFAREKEGEMLARELLPLTVKIVNILLAMFGLVIILDHFSIDIRSIVFTLGIGGLGVGLALQDTFANIFGGFTIMLITGVLLFYAIPIRSYQNIFFRLKLITLVLAGVNAWYFHEGIHKRVADWDRDVRTPSRARAAGVVSLVCWAVVVVSGRMIAYNWFDCDMQPQPRIVNTLAGCVPGQTR